MVARLSQPPALGEIIKRAKRYGFTKHTINVPGVGRIVYLRRGKGADPQLIDLPPGGEAQRLTRTVARGLCERLGIPPEDFGLGLPG